MSDGLKISGLTIGYKKPILSNVTLDLGNKGVWPMLGRNGSGKTTLLLTIAQLLPAMEGRVSWQDESVRKMGFRARAKLISVVLTQQAVPGGLDVQTLIAMGRFPYLSLMGKAAKKDLDAVASAIKTVGLEGFEDRRLFELSDGERQKVLIARALCQATPIMILDEPTVFLDYVARKEIVDLLFELGKDRLILFSTHDIAPIIEKSCPFIFIEEGTAKLESETSVLGEAGGR